MGPVGQFVLALIVGITSLASGSLIWPRLTSQTRPKLLQDVHDIVLKTSIGKQGASVLGVSDEANVQPINIGQAVGSAAANMRNAVQSRVQAVVVGNAVNQLSSQFERLPKDQKEHIQQILCKPLDPEQQ